MLIRGILIAALLSLAGAAHTNQSAFWGTP
jgi:hypothetical protein